jgi:squalene-associated FAD-dependent desaturase
VVGGGLAGITAAIELAEAGLTVTLVEARPWLGGATCSFSRRGLAVDNGQHVFLRCWTSYRGLLAKLGVAQSAPIQNQLDLTVLAAGGQARLRRSALPPPLHLAGSLARYRLLSLAERLVVARAVAALHRPSPSGRGTDDAGLADWLSGHYQSERSRKMFWDALTVPAMNAEASSADPGLATGLLAEALAGRDNADIGIPLVPLSQLHGGPAAALLARLGADVRLRERAVKLNCDGTGGYVVELDSVGEPVPDDQLPFERDEPEPLRAAAVVLAIPAWEAAAIVPAELADEAARWGRLEPSPIVSLHVVYAARVTDLPFAVTADLPVRWIIDKTSAAGLHAGQYLAASMPAADRYVDMPSARLRAEFLPVLDELFPAAVGVGVEDFFVTRERRATFRPVPGANSLRPAQPTRLRGLALAGAWTSTGLPDCMEGAVRSGRLAARSVIAHFAGTSSAHAARLAVSAAAQTKLIADPRPVLVHGSAAGDPRPDVTSG